MNQPGLFDDQPEDPRFDAASAEYDSAALVAEVRKLQQTNARLLGRIRELLRRMSTPGRCRDCGQGVLYDDDGQIHFATCPERGKP